MQGLTKCFFNTIYWSDYEKFVKEVKDYTVENLVLQEA